MNNWILQTFGINFKCELGPSGNLCKDSTNPCDAGLACCQQSNGCNNCVGK